MQNYSTSNTNQSNTSGSTTPVVPNNTSTNTTPIVTTPVKSVPATNSTSLPITSIQDKKAKLEEFVKEKVKVEEIEPGIYRATTDISKYIIEYDKNKCIGAASCADIAANTFFMNEENKAELKQDTENYDDDETILAAAQSCPVFAIKIIVKETQEVLFPIE